MWKQALAVHLALLGYAHAQSVPIGPIQQNQVWTIGQWTTAWQSKADASAKNVKTSGATGNGVTDDTASIQAAATAAAGGSLYFPAGTYLVSSPIRISSNTRVFGDGPGSLLTASSSGAWVDQGHVGAAPYVILTNTNYGTFPIVDHDIVVRDLAFSWAANDSGAAHSVRFFAARSVRVLRCISTNGGDLAAFIGVDDGAMVGNTSHEARNCPYDCWHGSTDIRILDNYAKSAVVLQFANFNATGGAAGGDPQTAQRAIISRNTFINTGTGAGSINLNPLVATCTVSDVEVSDNVLVNGLICGVGDVRDVRVSGNTLLSVPTTSAIFFFTDGTTAPRNIVVDNNSIIDPGTIQANVAVIRIEADGYSIHGNSVTGTGYWRACYTGSSVGVVGINNFAAGLAGVTGRVNGTAWTSQGYSMQLPPDALTGWIDTSGNASTMGIASASNTWFFLATTAAGAARQVMSLAMHSDVSGLSISLTTNFGIASANSVRITGASAGAANGPLIQANPNSSDTNVRLTLLGKGVSGVGFGATVDGSTPSTTTVGAGTAQVWKNTGDGTVKLYYNDGGSLKSVTLT